MRRLDLLIIVIEIIFVVLREQIFKLHLKIPGLWLGWWITTVVVLLIPDRCYSSLVLAIHTVVLSITCVGLCYLLINLLTLSDQNSLVLYGLITVLYATNAWRLCKLLQFRLDNEETLESRLDSKAATRPFEYLLSISKPLEGSRAAPATTIDILPLAEDGSEIVRSPSLFDPRLMYQTLPRPTLVTIEEFPQQPPEAQNSSSIQCDREPTTGIDVTPSNPQDEPFSEVPLTPKHKKSLSDPMEEGQQQQQEHQPSQPSQDKPAAVCAICLDQLAAGTLVPRLPCEHVYCILCLAEWLTIKNECPLCRSQVVPADYCPPPEG